MTQKLTTGDENAGQTVDIPVPGRASPVRVKFVPDGGSGGTSQPLSTVLFADLGTVVPLPDQNGAIDTPFALLQDAIDANPVGGTVYMTPGDYGNTNAVLANSQFYGMSGKQATGPVTIGTITIDAGISVWFENISVGIFATLGDNSYVDLLNCSAGGQFGDGTNSGTLVARLSTLAEITGGTGSFVDARNCQVANLTCEGAFLESCSIAATAITVSGTLTIQNLVAISPGLTITCADLEIDAVSLRRLVFAGCTFVVSGTITGFGGSIIPFGRSGSSEVGEFVPFGTMWAQTGNGLSESENQVTIPERSVLCQLAGFSDTDVRFRVRVNGADSALFVDVNNSQVIESKIFVEAQPGDLVAIQRQEGDPVGIGNARISLLVV